VLLKQIRRSRCWVVVLDERLIGLSIVHPPSLPGFCSLWRPRSGAQLRELAIRPEYQSKGIGSRLLRASEEGAVEMKAWNLWGSSPVGARQLRLYQRSGYRIAEYVAWPGTGYQSAIFTKCLHEASLHRPWDRVRSRAHRAFSLFKYYVRKYIIGLEGSRIRRRLRPTVKAVTRLISKCSLALRFTQNRDILICCNDPLMADYLAPFWELFRSDPRLRFELVFPPLAYGKWSEDRIASVRRQLPLHETTLRQANGRAWNLVVCADHCFQDIVKCSPSVYIGHGPKCKVMPGEKTEYSHRQVDGRGRSLYRRIFEQYPEDAEQAIRENPALGKALVVVGNLEQDRVLTQAKERERFRSQFGFGPQDVVVFIVSTWGEHCLWHTMGDELLEEARKLKGVFRFILSAPPHEYRPRSDGGRVWGEYLRAQKQHGFIVREPSESWIPYMVASDVVVSDYTGLLEYAVLLEKRILLTPVPDETIWPDSVIGKIRRLAPILKDARTLREGLLDTLQRYPAEQLGDLARSIRPHRGQAADRIRQEVYSLLRIPAPPQERGCVVR
jgi:GNAT superfamily N-acetyltransferase